MPGRLDWSPAENWVEKFGGLPRYVEEIALAIMRSGKGRSKAIQMAIGAVQRWARGGGDVNPDTRAKAQKAVAEWEALKARARAARAAKAESVADADLSEVEDTIAAWENTLDLSGEQWDEMDRQVIAAMGDQDPVSDGGELTGPFVAKNEARRIAYAPVLVPGEPDADGEVVTKAKVEEVAHEWLAAYRHFDADHDLKGRDVVPVESWITTNSMTVSFVGKSEGQRVVLPAGSWLMAAKMKDEEIWQGVMRGEYGGFSVMGVRADALRSATKSGTPVTLQRTLLSDLGEDWVAPVVSIVRDPAVPKAKWFALKAAPDQPWEDVVPDNRGWAALKRDYDAETRRQLADEGKALPDGSFPIKDRKDLRDAVRTLSLAKESKQDRARRHIIKRARELDALDVIPDDWNVSEKSRAAQLQQEIEEALGLATKQVSTEDQVRIAIQAAEITLDRTLTADEQDAVERYVRTGDAPPDMDERLQGNIDAALREFKREAAARKSDPVGWLRDSILQHVGKARGWNPALHPRGPDGKFIERGGGVPGGDTRTGIRFGSGEGDIVRSRAQNAVQEAQDMLDDADVPDDWTREVIEDALDHVGTMRTVGAPIEEVERIEELLETAGSLLGGGVRARSALSEASRRIATLRETR